MALIQGTDNPETLNGTPDDDTIIGLKGNDTLNGFGGDDLFVWSRGDGANDHSAWSHGDGADIVSGGDGSDTFQVNIPYYETLNHVTIPWLVSDAERARIEVDPVTGHVIFDSYAWTEVHRSGLTASAEETSFHRTDLQSIEHLQIIGGAADAPADFEQDNPPYSDYWHHIFSTNDSFVLPNLAATGIVDVSFDGGSGNDTFDATLAGVAVIAHGGTGNDVLNGGSGDSTLVGDDGNDILRAGGGPSTLVGGTGDDVYFVNKASDIIIELPGEGNDAVFATSASYTLSANVENLFYLGTQSFTGIGNAGDNWIQGGVGSDYLIGLGGNDTLYDGGSAPDAMQGGTGDDTYVVEAAGDNLIEFAGEGHDRVLTTLTSFTLGANIEDLKYSGGQSFTGIGNELDNTIQGGNGNDVLTGLGGYNALIGGPGSDTADYSAAPGAISVNLSSGQGLNGYGQTDTFFSIENITGSNNDDTIIGNSSNNTLNGGGGADTLVGGDGNDTLIGGAGAANTMQGGAGNDTYIAQAVGDSIIEFANEGTDLVQTGLGFLIMAANVENLTHTGSNDFTGIGNELSNLIVGGTGNDYLVGAGGNDTLIDGAGLNTLQGGLGDDIYAVQSNADTVFEFAGEGNDEVQTFLASYTLSPDVEKLTFIGSSSHTGTGNLSNNTFTGKAGDDTFTGAGGIDTYNYRTAGNGFDTINDFNADNANAIERDFIDLTGRGLNFGALALTSVTGGVVVGISGGDAVLLKGVLIGQLDAGDFLF
ncbi:Bifunctional hemolysin/adenylate cyclase [Bradyrhizobium ivorense]|uniref:Bifunctional hemolysin/adenylate cyclase n=1 Tax=Bradyrhizobium ivorense TaxID=2511166 RepID=A0A508TM27_9BRAD|nr:calcium-binding protein [Bradyrhizobium ivorense]VIO75410.1 Bifunctional hemolysin/adenylate cyclase [Bradyrhizobium ivorense]